MAGENPVAQQLHLLMQAYGYNLYNEANRARADDLLVRERASVAVGNAAQRVSQLATDYAARCIPPSTREQPFPPAERMALLRELDRLKGELSGLSSSIRGMSVPARDETWAKLRGERETLQRLIEYDWHLVTAANAVQDSVEGVAAEDWTDARAVETRKLLATVRDIARERERFLNGSG